MRAILDLLATEGAPERAASLPREPAADRREKALLVSAVAAVVVLAFSLRLPGLATPSLYLDDTWVALLARDASISPTCWRSDLLIPSDSSSFWQSHAVSCPEPSSPVQLVPFAASLALVPLGAWLALAADGRRVRRRSRRAFSSP